MEVNEASGIIRQFAKDYSLDTWDWFAAIVAVSSLVIAVSSLVIAFKTLRSQKATQQNTAPVVTMAIQKMLWLKLIEQIYLDLMRLHALRILLERCNYTKKPEEIFIQNFHINEDDFIHEELFYNQERRFAHVHRLKEQIVEYNRFFLSYANIIKERTITEDRVERMILRINVLLKLALKEYLMAFRENDLVMNGVDVVAKVGFDEDVIDELADNYKKYQIDFLNYFGTQIEYGTVLKEKERYSCKDSYVEFFSYFGEGKYNGFITTYYEYSNKYLEFLLSNVIIVLEDNNNG